MELQYGMSTMLELMNICENATLCNKLGLEFIEINMNLPQYQTDSFPIRECLALMDMGGIYFTIHLDENLNVCDFNKAVSSAYLDTVMRTIEIAQYISAPIINMHIADGVHFKLPNEKVYLFEQYRDLYLETQFQFRNACEQAIGSDAITICVENCGAFQPFQEAGIELLLESPALGLTYDIGHDHAVQNANREFYLAHANKLKHMHIHDANENTCHMVLGSGEVDIRQALQMARQNNARCVLETKTVAGLCESIAFIRDEL